MAKSRKRTAQNLQLDEIYLEGAQERAGFWSDEGASARPVSSRKDIVEFEAVQRPANDEGRRSRRQFQQPSDFFGSRYFLLALAATFVLCGLFALLMGFSNAAAFAALAGNPGQYAMFWAALAVIATIPWLLALSAHRQSASDELLRRVMIATQRLQEPGVLAADAGRRINTSFEHVFADMDARMSQLDERSAKLANKIAAAMQHSTEAADGNITNMRSIVESSETQREALHRTGMMISTDILPVISKLETTVQSLKSVSQTAGGVLDGIGLRLQQTTQDLKSCLDAFTNANHTVAPEIERRMVKFEASIAQLPEQLDATISRLTPLSETIADAALLSTANIEVIDQLAKDMTAALEKSRSTFADLSVTGAQLFEQAVDAHADRYRELLQAIVAQEANRISGLSREIDHLADTATAVVSRLQQPVGEVTAATDRALANVNDAISALDQRIEANLAGCVADLNDTAARLVSSVNREIETSSVSMQTRLAAGATELMQRVHADTMRFESLIGETAERSSARIAAVIKDLPAVLAQRMDTEIAKIDGSLKGSIFGLSDQMRQIVDAVPNRLFAMTRDTLQSLETNLLHSFEDVAQRSEQLNEQFRRNATETTEAVLQGYVDFIFMAAARFREELEQVNESFSTNLEARLQALPRGGPATLAASADQSEPLANREPGDSPGA